jgi:integrase
LPLNHQCLLSKMRRAAAVRFRDALQQWAVENGKTARTADNTLTSIKALANIARDREWMEGNPFERLAVTKGGKDSEGREPWTPDEMAVLFDAPLFKAYELPEGDSMATKAGDDAAYWVPLLAAYTGARPSELCQLWTDDLSEGEGGLVVEFRSDADRGQRLKDKKETKKGASWRAVPIHSELIRLGLRDYWEAVKARNNGCTGPLFPSLPKGWRQPRSGAVRAVVRRVQEVARLRNADQDAAQLPAHRRDRAGIRWRHTDPGGCDYRPRWTGHRPQGLRGDDPTRGGAAEVGNRVAELP